MRRVGQARRRDANEAPIIEALEEIGIQVLQLSGKGVPDLLCYSRGSWIPLEVKMPKGELTSAQIAVRATAPYPVVTTVGEALAIFGVRS